MPVETEEDRALFVDADEFGCAVSWTRGVATTAFSAIFDEEYIAIASPLLDSVAEGAGPRILCRSSDLPAGARKGDTIVVVHPVTGQATSFKAVEMMPDGTGMTSVRLQEA